MINISSIWCMLHLFKPTVNRVPKEPPTESHLYKMRLKKTFNLQESYWHKITFSSSLFFLEQARKAIIIHIFISHSSYIYFVKGLLTFSFYLIHYLNQHSYKPRRSKILWYHFSFKSAPFSRWSKVNAGDSFSLSSQLKWKSSWVHSCLSFL